MDPGQAVRSVRSVTRLGCWLTGLLPDRNGIPILERVSALAVAAEAAGFDSFWLSDQVEPPTGGTSGTRNVEAYSLLGALATRTRGIRLGAVPVVDGGRPPAMVAKIVAGVDVISHGRGVLSLRLGEGGGEEELSALEAIAVSRTMLDDESPTFAGSVYTVEKAFNRPKPVQVGGVPLVVVVMHPVSRTAGSIAVVAASADAVVIEASDDAVSALIAETGGSGPGVIAVGPTPAKPTAWGSRESLDLLPVVQRVRALFELGVDGCMVPVSAHTVPEDLSRIGEALVTLGSTTSGIET